MSGRTPSVQAPRGNLSVPQVIQPIVRVMRLYKPGLYTNTSFTPLAMASGNCRSVSTRDADGSDFSISPYLLLPDSFGDIYLGETFSSYVAVVNPVDNVLFTNVTLQLHLLSTNTTIELEDVRASPEGQQEAEGVTLTNNELTDKVIMRTLTELNTHTLRVTVNYSIGRGAQEMKTMRKFYRFNVLQPLSMTTSLRKMGPKVAIQCSVSNSTQTPIFIEGAQFISAITGVSAETTLEIPHLEEPTISPALLAPLSTFNLASVPILQPGEKHGFGFIVSAQTPGAAGAHEFLRNMSQKLGHVEVTWCAHMGERGVLRGNDLRCGLPGNGSSTGGSVVPAKVVSSSSIQGGSDKLECVCCTYPTSNVKVGSRFPLSISCLNHTAKTVVFRLETAPATREDSSDKNITNTNSDNDNNTGMELELPISTFTVGPGEMIECPCTVAALKGGLQGLRELRAVSIDGNFTYFRSKDLVHVLVAP